MGYQLPERTAVLAFEEGHRLAGLELTVSLSLPLDFYSEMWELWASKKPESLAALMDRFAAMCLRGWNVTDADGPVPATAESLRGKVDLTSAMQMIGKYLKQIGVLSDPKQGRSASTKRSDAPRKSKSRKS